MENSAEFSADRAPHKSVDRSAIIDAAAILVEKIIDKSVETIALRDTEMDLKEHNKKEKRKRKRGRARRNKKDSVQSKGCDKSINIRNTDKDIRQIVEDLCIIAIQDEVGQKLDKNLGPKMKYEDNLLKIKDFSPLDGKIEENTSCSDDQDEIQKVLDINSGPKMEFKDNLIENTDLCLLVNKIKENSICSVGQDEIETTIDYNLGPKTESSKKFSVVKENMFSSGPMSSLGVDPKSGSTGKSLGKELEAGPNPGRRKDFVPKPKFTQRSWLDDDNGEDDDGSDDDLLMVNQNIGSQKETNDNEAAPVLGSRFFAPCKNTIEPIKLEGSSAQTHVTNVNIVTSNEKVVKKNCFDRRINEKCQNLSPDKNVNDKFLAKVVVKTVANCATEKLSKCNERIVGKQLLKNNFASAIEKNVAVSSGPVSKSLPSNLQDHTTIQLTAYKNRFTGCSTMQNFEQCDMNNTIIVKNDVNIKIGTNVNNLNVDATKSDKIKRSRRKTEPFDFELQSDGVLIKNNNPVVEKIVEKPIVYSNSFSNSDKTRNLFSGFISDSGVFVPTSNMDKRSSRDSLDRIFDEECSDEDSLDGYEQDYDDGEGSESENESSDCRSDSEDEALPPEPQLGNVEYKLKLVNPTKQRFEHLVTQMKWRLREGRGEALYEIGVRDCGRVRGLSSRDLRASLRTLRRMAARLGAGCALLTRGRVPGNPKRERAEVLVRKIPDDQHNIEVRVAVMGSNDAGKSTLVGVLTQGELDNGRGRARLNMFRHLHEVRTGRTSSVSHEILGFDPQGHPINYAYSELMTSEEIAERSSKLVSFIDLAGHRKYLKTTVQGLTGYSPHYAMLVVSATAGINQMTLEHLALVTALDLPFFIAVTKTDSTPPDKVIESLRQALNTIGCRKVPLPVLTQDDVILAASNALSRVAVPVFPVSSVSGCGLDRLGWFLFLAPPAMATCERDRLEQEPVEFQIDETFKVGGTSGPVVGGLLTKGVLTERTRLLIGPLDSGDFAPITVISLHRNKAPCRVVRAGQAASLGLSVRPPTLRQGMVILAIPDGYPGQTPKHNLARLSVAPQSKTESASKKEQNVRGEPVNARSQIPPASEKNKMVSVGKECNLKIREEDIAEIVDGIGVKGKNGRDVNLVKLVADGEDKLVRLSPSRYTSRFVSPFGNGAPSVICSPSSAVDLDVDSIECDDEFDDDEQSASDSKDTSKSAEEGSADDSGKDTSSDIDEGILKEDPNNPRGCYCFQATVSVLYHSTAIYPGFQATVHIGNIRQTAVIEGILAANSVLRAKDRAPVVFRFVRHPEYVKTGAHLLFREGLHTKGIGVVTQVFPHVSTDVRRNN